jgi:hypothetical protein
MMRQKVWFWAQRWFANPNGHFGATFTFAKSEELAQSGGSEC